MQLCSLDGITLTPCLTTWPSVSMTSFLPHRWARLFLFCPICTWQNMGDALSPNSAQIGPTLTLPEAFVNRLEGKRLEENKNDHRTKQKYMCQYFPKCDFFTSIFSEAEFLNFFQEFLHRLLPSNLPEHLQHSKDAFSLSHLKTMENRTNPPNQFS